MTWVEAALLGVVEGLTEFLPVSSTGHLILTGEMLGLEEGDFGSSFNIVIQLGAVTAVLCLYGRRLLVERPVLLRVACAFVPFGLIAFFLYPVVKEHLLKNVETVLWTLAIGGMVMVLFERLHGERSDARNGLRGLSLPAAACIGVFQAFALLPGMSRSAATVLGGLALGYRRRDLVEFSFLLAVPTMFVATGYDLYTTRDRLSLEQIHLLLIGLGVSFLVALLAIRLLLRFVQSHSFAAFGIYRIGAALLFLAFYYR